MDNLPKDQSDDISAFAGSYPTQSEDKPVKKDEQKAPSAPAPFGGSVSGGINEQATPPVVTSVSGEQPVSTPPPPIEPTAVNPDLKFGEASASEKNTAPFQTVPEIPSGTDLRFGEPQGSEKTLGAGGPVDTGSATEAPFVASEEVPSGLSPSAPPPSEPAAASYESTTPSPEETVMPSGPEALGAGSQPPPKKSSGMLKRLLMLLVLLIVIGALGFVAFSFLGRFMTRNEPVTLTYWGLWEDEQLLKPVIDAYKKSHPDVDVVYTQQSVRQYRERLQAAIDRGEGPDIFRFHASWVPMLRNQLAPAGSTGYSASEFSQTFYPSATKDLVIGGKVYGVPLMIEGLGLYYNEDLLRAAGVTPPTSWNEFLETAKTLTVKDETGRIITSGAALGTTNNVEHFSDIVGLMMLQNGANLKNPISKEAQDSLTFYRVFAEAPNNVWDESLDNSITAFASGRVAMIFAPSWQVFTIKDMNPGLKFQIIPVPQLPGTQVAWASYWAEGVAADSKDAEAAWEFLKFLSSKEQMTILFTEESKSRLFGEPYSRVDLAQTLINDPLIGAYIKQAPTAQSFFLSSRTFDNGINDRMIKYTEDGINSLTKGVSIEAVLETMNSGYSQVLSSYSVSTTAP